MNRPVFVYPLVNRKTNKVLVFADAKSATDFLLYFSASDPDWVEADHTYLACITWDGKRGESEGVVEPVEL